MLIKELSGLALDAQNKMISELRAKGDREIGPGKWILRPLRPEDVELTTSGWLLTCSTNSAWGTFSELNTVTIDDQRFVGINGVFYTNANPEVTQLKIEKAGRTVRHWHIQPVPDFQNKRAWFTDPIIIDQNTQLTVNHFNETDTTQTKEHLGFLGYVVEPRGLVIDPIQ